ncbi:30S ribosomal protein S2 [Patescibacteria group bacterium]|nr:30S ribosomal protein S2 [Patescibacteria group bacterium]MBU1722190.1 30S ribosomal protein S2 [Patescibacteria group bacterium]MBU1901141.1 30S ribosomal protein S2 [Patescibacteria group bacterium]
MQTPTLIEMLKAGVHFGHQKFRWHPKMDQYIFTERHGVHILDLEKTQAQLAEVLPAVQKMAAEGKQIVFVSTKPQARAVVKQAAEACGMPYLTERWLGGMLTNFAEIKKLIKKYNSLKEQQANGELEKYTKKERVAIGKQIEKMDTYLSGLADLKAMPDAIFVPAVQREKTAVTEANRTGVTVIGVCDTNANPNRVTHVIPANDDAVRSIEMMVNLVRDAIEAGKKEFEQKKTLDKKEVVPADMNKFKAKA